MSVVEVVPGKVVRVEPDELDVNDVIELAEALIEEHGWIGNDKAEIDKYSGGSPSAGWTLHAAVGEAAKRATGSGAKDSASARPWREEAAQLVKAADGGRFGGEGRNEMEINDQALSADVVLTALRAARGVS